MTYTFDIIGTAPVLQFFNHQQRHELTHQRSHAYVGSYQCTLDAFIQATELVYRKPAWDWDAVVQTMVNFWLTQGDQINHWKTTLQGTEPQTLIVGRVTNFDMLRNEFETLFET